MSFLLEVNRGRLAKKVKAPFVFRLAAMPFFSLFQIGFLRCCDNGSETKVADRVEVMGAIIESMCETTAHEWAWIE